MSSDDQTPVYGATDAIDSISELARQRRALAEQQSERPIPDFIRSVESSEVIYYFFPSALPFRQLDLAAVSAALSSLYEVQIQGPDLSPLLKTLTLEQVMELNEEERMARLVRVTDVAIEWTNGKFPLRDDYVPIRTIAITYEAVQIAVSGVSEVAEVIAKEVVELLWQLAGSKRKYADVEKHLKLVGYGTATRLELGYGPECLLNPKVMEFLDSNLSNGSRYAESMGIVPVRSGTETKRQVNAVAALDDLTLKVITFDPATGYAENCEIQFSIMGTADFKTGSLRARSAQPFEKHVDLLSNLFQAVNQS
jgi:hypothetical protein